MGGATIIIPNGGNTSGASASSLKDATGVVDVSAATAPSTGQVLTATDATHATWQPAAGGAPTGAAGGILSGTYPNPGIADNPGLTGGYTADLQGYLSWAYDPLMADAATVAPTSGVLYTVMVPWPYKGKAITNIDYAVGTAATTPVAGQNFVAVYGPAGGTALGSLASDTAFTGGPGKTAAIAVAAAALPATGPGAYIYVAFLQNAATAGTLSRRGNGSPNALVDAQLRSSTSARFGTFGTAQTTVPSLTVASIAASHVGFSIWVGVR